MKDEKEIRAVIKLFCEEYSSGYETPISQTMSPADGFIASEALKWAMGESTWLEDHFENNGYDYQEWLKENLK